MEDISQLESEIRDFINNPRKQCELLKNPAAFNKLTSSLDVVGDTELAIDAFLEKDWPDDDGSKYLILYGLLQSLFIQQDAVKHLSEALDIEYSLDPLLNDIREIRHDSIGHPTKRGRGDQENAYNFIARISMSRNGLMLMKTFPDGSAPQFINANLPSLITKQRDKLAVVMSGIIDILKKEELEHKKMFKDEKLKDIFPPVISYYFQKISEAIYGARDLGLMHLKLVNGCIERFRDALEKRGILEAYYSVTYNINLINYPIHELMNFFEDPEKSKLNENDAYIFKFFVEQNIETLIQIAKEIDEDYAKDI